MKGLGKENFLRKIFDSSLDGIIITDMKGYITEANKAFMKLVGYNKKEVIGKHMVEFSPMKEGAYESTTGELIHLDKKFHDNIKSTMTSFVEKGKLSNAMGYQLRKDGKIVPVEDNMVFLFDSRGEKHGAFAIIRDITERKKEAREIHEKKEFLENIFKTTVDGIMIADYMGNVIMVNDAAEKMLGFSHDQLIGMHTSELEEQKYHASGEKLIEKLLIKGTISGVERTWLKKNGESFNIELNIALLKDGNGNITSSVAGFRDITERKKSEETLKESEEKYYNLIESANDAIVSVNQAGMIVGFNKKAEELFGYSRREVLGKSSYLLISHQKQKYYKEALKHFAKTGTGLDRGNNILEGRGVKKGGEEFLLEYSYYSIKTSGEFIATAIIRDITKRKEEEQKIINYQNQLKALTSELILSEQKERQHFADFLHDEVGQQLFATRLQLEQLKGSLSSAENAKTMDKALNNLYQVMNQTRSLTSELSSPILKQLGLERALEWLAEQMHKKYEILVTFEDDKQEKPLDDNLKIFLYQTVSELLTNVAKHAQTKIASVSIKRADSNVQICVEDSGIGFMVPKGDFSDQKIEGLGLFRIKERLGPLGGHFEIKTQPNCGTKITLFVPLNGSV